MQLANSESTDKFKKEFSREAIRNRMIQDAVKLWGLERYQWQKHDPITDLLLGACAVELEAIANELLSSQTRIVNRLAELFLPDVKTRAIPAHSILHLRPLKQFAEVCPDNEISCNKEISNKQTIEISFTPSRTFKVFNGDVKFLAYGSKIIQLENITQKRNFAEAKGDNSLEESVLWIGIELDTNIHSLEELSFFFSGTNGSTNQFIQQSLFLLSHWFVGEREITVDLGIKKKTAKGSQDATTFHQGTEDSIDAYYKNNFVTVIESPDKTPSDLTPFRICYPPEFSNVFPNEILNELKNKLIWIKIIFPKFIPPKIISDLNCQINCFPVINRKKLSEKGLFYKMVKGINVIPLLIDGYFLEMIKVRSDRGQEYHEDSLHVQQSSSSKSYSLRQVGVARYDKRDASEMLAYILDLAREENAAFASAGLERVYNGINTLIEEINIARNQYNAEVDKDSPFADKDVYYLLIDNEEDEGYLYINFWYSQGEWGNKIQPEHQLHIYGTDFQRNSAKLILSSHGGRVKPENMEYLFREALLSRGRFVTAEDIKSACYSVMGNYIQKVQVNKTFKINHLPHCGYERVVEVILKLSDEQKPVPEALRANLEVYLNTNSASVCQIIVKCISK